MDPLNVSGFSKIILAVDGSENSKSATELLNRLPLPSECAITVLAILDTPHTPRRQILLAALEGACTILKTQGHKVECGLLHGHPAATLTEFADNYRPNLIILGAKGLRATLGIFLGGVAQQLVEYAHWPVLIVRPLSPDIRNILIALDGSEYSQQALEYLFTFPYPSDVKYHVVHVVPPLPSYESGNIPRSWLIGTEVFQVPPVDMDKYNQDLHIKDEAKGESILEQAKIQLEKHGIYTETFLLHGDAATEILEYSKNNLIDLIVVGSRGLSEVRGWLLGSVSRKLVHYATASVLIVKHFKTDEIKI
jgi:nucleotide-binding universal stress UspA family protein